MTRRSFVFEDGFTIQIETTLLINLLVKRVRAYLRSCARRTMHPGPDARVPARPLSFSPSCRARALRPDTFRRDPAAVLVETVLKTVSIQSSSPYVPPPLLNVISTIFCKYQSVPSLPENFQSDQTLATRLLFNEALQTERINLKFTIFLSSAAVKGIAVIRAYLRSYIRCYLPCTLVALRSRQ